MAQAADVQLPNEHHRHVIGQRPFRRLQPLGRRFQVAEVALDRFLQRRLQGLGIERGVPGHEAVDVHRRQRHPFWLGLQGQREALLVAFVCDMGNVLPVQPLGKQGLDVVDAFQALVVLADQVQVQIGLCHVGRQVPLALQQRLQRRVGMEVLLERTG